MRKMILPQTKTLKSKTEVANLSKVILVIGFELD